MNERVTRRAWALDQIRRQPERVKMKKALRSVLARAPYGPGRDPLSLERATLPSNANLGEYRKRR